MKDLLNKLETKKPISFRAHTELANNFDALLLNLRRDFGETLTKEQALEYLMEFALKMKPKEFLALYHAHKADKFSKG